MNGKNKLMLVAAIGAVLVLIASTAVRCAVTRAVSDEPAAPAAEAETQDGQSSGAAASGGAQEPKEDTVEGSTEDKVLSALRSHAWQAEGDAGTTISFRDGSFVEADADGFKVTAFEVTGAAESDDHAALDVTCTRDGDGGAFRTVIAVDGREGSLKVSSDGFANASAYVQGSANAGPVAVDGITEPYTGLVDGKDAELAAAIASYCADHVPTATKAEFDGEVFLDIPGKRVTATFHCDDKAATVLSVAYADGAFTVIG
ncbi:MAG: hypothetical protein IJ111_09490 [Eggerthellaceae bacterium]|nr:hypothetical protein [Eggerthellaceae bacterium]